MAVYSYGRIELWPYIVMAVYSYGPTKLWPGAGVQAKTRAHAALVAEVGPAQAVFF